MAGAYRTEQDLITEVLANLGVLAAGQAIDPEDNAYVSEKLDSIFRKLAALEIVYIADANNIPGVFFSDLADIVAGEVATKFGVTSDDYQKLVDKGLGGVSTPIGGGAAAKSLKQIGRGRATGEPLRPQFF